ncbi:MFS transporter [Pantoea stewartii]|uniref:MFS transporter n=1 Tax=Pantoea stewartii TaxID=66269 RepID=UPI0025A1B593|nr:MFS transporter [Pantoea stewartii]
MSERHDIKRKVLLAANVSYVLVILDTSVVNVALPTIKSELMLNVFSLQWIVNAYLLLFASLLLSGGALCDRYGSKCIYMSGLSFFALASLICGASSGSVSLLTGRVLQGITAAVLVPGSLSLITHTFKDKTERTQAIASWASWGGVALVLGPIVGGWMTEFFSWRSIFLINIPLCLLGILLARPVFILDEGEKSTIFDIKGQVLIFLFFLTSLSLVMRISDHNHFDIYSLFSIFIALALAFSFILIERKTSNPILPLSLFRNSNFCSISWIFFAGAFSFFGTLFILTFWFQYVLNFSALKTGMLMLPLSLSVIAGNKVSGILSHRYKTSSMMIFGALLRLFGYAGLLATQYSHNYYFLILPMVLIGFGGGLGSPMSTSLFMQSVPKKYTGLASGISRATGQMGSALAVAVFAKLVSSEFIFISNLKYALLTIIFVTFSIVLINIFGVNNDMDVYQTSTSDGAKK